MRLIYNDGVRVNCGSGSNTRKLLRFGICPTNGHILIDRRPIPDHCTGSNHDAMWMRESNPALENCVARNLTTIEKTLVSTHHASNKVSKRLPDKRLGDAVRQQQTATYHVLISPLLKWLSS